MIDPISLVVMGGKQTKQNVQKAFNSTKDFCQFPSETKRIQYFEQEEIDFGIKKIFFSLDTNKRIMDFRMINARNEKSDIICKKKPANQELELKGELVKISVMSCGTLENAI